MSDEGSSSPRFRVRPLADYTSLATNPYLVLHHEFGLPVLTAQQAQEACVDWAAHFGRPAPLHLEIGSGNGFFFAGMAKLHPEWNWLGVEIRFKRVILTARKLQSSGSEEFARIARYNAFYLDDILGPASLAGVYVNHPDPWPRYRQAGNRLLARPFAEKMAHMLAPGGRLRLKTDHRINIDGLTKAIEGLPLREIGRSKDITKEGTPWPDHDDVITNYQSKFDKKNEPVYALWLERL
jgi:tRNA (guanine-N7-)-methyltransferase